jgi:CubicO group peptidase (beta-lactamase class C family)
VSFVAEFCGKKLIYVQGVKRWGSTEPITPSTPMRLSSNTKQFTALAVLHLASQGKLDLRATLGEIFTSEAAAAPDVRAREGEPIVIPDAPAEAALRGITVLGLLQMQSGIAAEPDDAGRCRDYAAWAPRTTDYEVLRGLARHPQFVDGNTRVFRYCNANYAILSTVVERASHSTFEAYVRDDITGPLGMTETGIIDFAYPQVTTLPHANERPWGNVVQDDNPVPHQAGDRTDAGAGVVGDGEMWSTAEDMLKWLDYWNEPKGPGFVDRILGGAVYRGGQVTPLTPGDPPPAGVIHLKEAAIRAVGSAGGYALGWERHGDDFHLGRGPRIAHAGGTQGFRSDVEFYPYPLKPDGRAGFALMSNLEDTLPAGDPHHDMTITAAQKLFADLAGQCKPATPR